MEQPYLPVLFEEIHDIKSEEFLSWPSQRVRILGKIVGNMLPRQGLKKKPTIQKGDKIYLKDPQKTESHSIVLDFDLVPDMPRTLYHESNVQVLGEITEIKDNLLHIVVHMTRDFSSVDVNRYYEAIGKQSLACPRLCLRKPNQMKDASEICEKDNISKKNVLDTSKDLFDDSSDENMEIEDKKC